jgi:hypothetical protein
MPLGAGPFRAKGYWSPRRGRRQQWLPIDGTLCGVRSATGRPKSVG